MDKGRLTGLFSNKLFFIIQPVKHRFFAESGACVNVGPGVQNLHLFGREGVYAVFGDFIEDKTAGEEHCLVISEKQLYICPGKQPDKRPDTAITVPVNYIPKDIKKVRIGETRPFKKHKECIMRITVQAIPGTTGEIPEKYF